MRLIIGTTNPSKIKAIENASKQCVYFKGMEIKIEGIPVPSDISEMPLSMEEIIEGAINRATNLIKSGEEGDYFLGVEGGTTIIHENAYLVGVVCIMSPNKKYHLGFSPFLEIPKMWQEELYLNKMDLGPLTDRETKETDTAKKNGAMGVLSDDMITRSEMFEQAFFCAISPFYNRHYQ